MRVLVWVAEGGWEAAVDAAAALPASELTLLHVAPEDVLEAPAGALAGLLGRHRRSNVAERVAGAAGEAAEALLAQAAERLGRDARRVAATGRSEAVVTTAAEQADVLVLAREGRRVGPRSLGHAARFVVDHAPCAVLLAWAAGAPEGPRQPPPEHSPQPGPPPGAPPPDRPPPP